MVKLVISSDFHKHKSKRLDFKHQSVVLTKQLIGESAISLNMCLENKSNSVPILGRLLQSGDLFLFLPTSVSKGDTSYLCP